MASDAVEIELSPTIWGGALERDLYRIIGHDAAEVEAFRAQIEDGEMQALAVFADGARIGSLVWSIAHEHKGRVCVLNALAADPVKGVSLTVEIVERFKALGAALGCVELRAWTRRQGMVRVLEKIGAGRACYVMEMRL